MQVQDPRLEGHSRLRIDIVIAVGYDIYNPFVHSGLCQETGDHVQALDNYQRT